MNLKRLLFDVPIKNHDIAKLVLSQALLYRSVDAIISIFTENSTLQCAQAEKATLVLGERLALTASLMNFGK